MKINVIHWQTPGSTGGKQGQDSNSQLFPPRKREIKELKFQILMMNKKRPLEWVENQEKWQSRLLF